MQGAFSYTDFHNANAPMSLWDPARATEVYGQGLVMNSTAHPGDGLGVIDESNHQPYSNSAFYGMMGSGFPDPVVGR